MCETCHAVTDADFKLLAARRHCAVGDLMNAPLLRGGEGCAPTVLGAVRAKGKRAKWQCGMRLSSLRLLAARRRCARCAVRAVRGTRGARARYLTVAARKSINFRPPGRVSCPAEQRLRPSLQRWRSERMAIRRSQLWILRLLAARRRCAVRGAVRAVRALPHCGG